jgi:hypothetical protein
VRAGGPLRQPSCARARALAGGLARAARGLRALADALAGGHAVRGAPAVVAEGGVPGRPARHCRGRALALGAHRGRPRGLRGRAGASAWDTIVAAILRGARPAHHAGLARSPAGSRRRHGWSRRPQRHRAGAFHRVAGRAAPGGAAALADADPATSSPSWGAAGAWLLGAATVACRLRAISRIAQVGGW